MIRIVRPQHPDIEEGMPQNAPLTDHNHHTYRRIVFSNKCVCGLVLFLLIFNYPIIGLLLMLSVVICLMSCFRFLTQHGHSIIGENTTAAFWNRASDFRFPGNINLTNLRLALIDRDFTADDYDMLLALDEPSRSGPASRQLTQEELSSLPLMTYQKSGEKEEICSICLETFETGHRLRKLQCRHLFHEACIVAWTKQKGITTKCPICNKKLLVQ